MFRQIFWTTLFFTALCGCATAEDPVNAGETPVIAEEDSELKAVTTLTEKDDGRTVAYAVGQKIVVALASNPTTGYDWANTTVEQTLGDPLITFVKGSSSAVGAGGTTKIMWFITEGMKGKHSVTLAYQRSWEKKPTKTIHLTFDIGAPKAIALGDGDNGKTVAVKAGDNVVLALSSNATTGYKWTVTSTDKTFGYPTEIYSMSCGAVGGGGVQTFTWKTASPLNLTGSHSVALSYTRSGDKTPSKTFGFTAKIQ